MHLTFPGLLVPAAELSSTMLLAGAVIVLCQGYFSRVLVIQAVQLAIESVMSRSALTDFKIPIQPYVTIAWYKNNSVILIRDRRFQSWLKSTRIISDVLKYHIFYLLRNITLHALCQIGVLCYKFNHFNHKILFIAT